MPEQRIDWNEAQVATLTKMWTDGKSAAEIAAALGHGTTRSAVIGKVHRLKLPGHGQNNPSKPRPKLKAPSGPKEKAARHGNGGIATKINRARKDGLVGAEAMQAVLGRPSVELVEEVEVGVDVSHLLGLTELTDKTCRFPIGDPQHADFGFCGDTPKPGSVYCTKHHRRAYIRL